MKAVFIASVFSLVGSCATTKYSTKIENLKKNIHLQDSVTVMKYANTITTNELEKHLYDFSSDKFEGRTTGSSGQQKAACFLKSYYENQNIDSPLENNTYFQDIPETYLPDKTGSSENVLAYIKGAEKPEEVVVISAHLDHLGYNQESNEIFYGADDNGSGNAAIMEIAQAFKLAEIDGIRPKRSVLFLHVTAEEIGLQGSLYYTENPVFDLKKTMTNLNIDMIGRVDDAHKNNPNYLYIIGADRISKELHFISEEVNNKYFDITLDYKYNDESDSNRYYYRSDHYNFARHNIPVIFYFNGEHADYHKTTDTPDKINYKLLEKRTRLIFATAWQLANQENQLIKNDIM